MISHIIKIITMNHNEVINHIKNNFKNIVTDKVKFIEHAVRTNYKNLCKLKNPKLHEYCIINSIEEFNTLLTTENFIFSSEIDADVDKYVLAVENDFFNEHIVISDCINIIPIKIERMPSTTSEDKDKDNDRDIEIYIYPILRK